MVRTVSQVVKLSLIAAVFAVGFAACGGGVGSGSNNDQGLAFTFIGFFQPNPENLSCNGTGLTEVSASLTSGVSDGADPFFGDVDAAIGLQNNLSGQAMRVDRLNYEYFIPGSDVQPPSTVNALPIVLGPGPGASDSSLPGGLEALPNCQASIVSVLPQQVRAWISLNRAFLPEAPFDMLLTMTAEGEASGGDRLTTNEQILVINVVPDTLIPGTGPAVASGGGAAAGAGAEGGGGVVG